MNELHPFLPDWTAHPGAFLDELLNQHGLTPEEFAPSAGIPLGTINGILDGTVAISEAVAVALGAAFDSDPQFWRNSQALYDSAIERGVVSVLTGRGERTPRDLAGTPDMRSMHDSNVRRFPAPH